MSKKLTHEFKEEKAVLVGLITNDQNAEQAKEYLEELDFLAHTAGAVAVKHFTQKLPFANPKTFIGKGKLLEVKAFMKEHEISLVIFDDELGPSQLRNLEKELECKIMDRSNLILDIFASRARTAHSRTQVELAQYQYPFATFNAYVDTP
jgi:GTP-binding protein HflX